MDEHPSPLAHRPAPLSGRTAPSRAVVVGAGSWGTAVARHLVRRGLETRLLCRRPEQAKIINRDHRNPDYLPDVPLPLTLQAASLEGEDLFEVDLVVLAVPSKAYAATAAQLAHRVRSGVALLSLTKGIEPESLRRLSVVIEESWRAARPQIAVLTGPNHAEEVSRDQPTATVIASGDADFACRLQGVLSCDIFRAYVSDDLVGVEIASAVKNVIALATGMSDGVGYGDNARAALMTRGLAEMARLGVRLGANGHTFAGLAGMGDLIATCTSRHSRNRRAGELIAQGRAPERVEEELGMVAEGLTAAPAIHRLGRDHDVEMPITENVCAIIAGEKDVRASVRDLMARPPRPEQV